MKKGKKLLALLMVAMLAVSAASCSSNETTSSSESSGTDSSAAASTDGEEKLDVTLSYMASQDWVQAVSYTHLDVYKRQTVNILDRPTLFLVNNKR